MIVLYTYPNKVVRYTDVAQIREQLDKKHVLRLRSGKFITPKMGWTLHEVKAEKGR